MQQGCVRAFVHACPALRAPRARARTSKPVPPLPPPRLPAVIIACATGGTLDTIVRVATTGKSAKDPDRAFGRETRSLKACYELMNAGGGLREERRQ